MRAVAVCGLRLCGLVAASAPACGCDGVLDTRIQGAGSTSDSTGGGDGPTGSGASSTGEGETSGGDSSASGTGTGVLPFGPCEDGGPCPLDPAEACITDDVDAPTYSFCSQTCIDVSDCPTPQSGTAAVSCEALTPLGIPFSACVLRCENGEICPDQMECTMILANLGWCTWPA